MDEHTPGEGGAANTPPFPRVDSRSEPVSPFDSDDEFQEPAPTPRLQDDTPLMYFDADDDDVEEEYDDEFLDDFDEFADEADDIPLVASADSSEGFASRARGEMKRRATESANRGFEQFADRLDEVAGRIERLANDRLQGPGRRERAAEAAQSTAGWITGVSDYLREADLEAVRSDLEEQVRRSPLRSILIAVGAGWLIGKIVR